MKFLTRSSLDKYSSNKLSEYFTLLIKKLCVASVGKQYTYLLKTAEIEHEDERCNHSLSIVDTHTHAVIMPDVALLSLRESCIFLKFSDDRHDYMSLSRCDFAKTERNDFIKVYEEKSADIIDQAITSFVKSISHRIIKKVITDSILNSGVIKSTISYAKGEYVVNMTYNLDVTNFDSRFVKVMLKNIPHLTKSLRILDDETDFDYITSVIVEGTKSITADAQRIYNQYQYFVDEIAGCTMYVGDAVKVLCHSSFRPSIGTKFVTFKCPFTDRIECYNIDKCDNISIEGLEETHGTAQFLLG